SEATKNAVLSKQGEGGYKKSFRHDRLVANYAVVDPELLASCPQTLIAANGMDAFTQLLESYVSTRANPFTDVLAMSGIRAVRDGLVPWYRNEGDIAQHRTNMAYGALLSGITLAQAGLGSVHGLAAPLGAFFPIPHGVVCGTLVAECTRMNIELLKVDQPEGDALWRYAHVGKVLANNMKLSEQGGLETLVEVLETWTHELGLPRLAEYGMTPADIPRVVANCRGNSMKTNPIVLPDDRVAEILSARL
ncbi:MAG TPA: iron-containing alcohol dehydrogenase, partial [Methylophilaceae bacterium]|nr:iron-containing alcohol dehydrogenase [Methylophilaceae bacterium]